MSKIILNGIEYSNGITYQKLQPVIYSDEEREVGVWRDGKPLYQKTLIYTGTYSGASGSVPINISDLDTVFCANGWGVISTNAICPLPYVHSSTNNNGGFFISADKTTIGIRFASGLTLTKLVFTLQYTKTTDTAGSGTWTPSGVKAVHYSTNEQVIGTWIDGKPLYQRTWDFGSNITINSNAWTNTTIDVAGNSIKAIINSKATNDGGTNYNFIACNIDHTYVQVLQTRNVAIVVRYLTLEYTKTTD